MINNKHYIKLRPLSLLGDLDEVVEELQRMNKEGELVSYEFNGAMLYSDTVTIDSAYRALFGMTKDEYQMTPSEKQKYYGETIDQLDKAKSSILEEQYIDNCDRMLEECRDDVRNVVSLESAMKIAKALNEGRALDEAQKVLNDYGYSDPLTNSVINKVKNLCARGDDFADYVHQHEMEPRQYMETLPPLSIMGDLHDVVKELQELNKQGRLVCYPFNGTMLYSHTVTIDSAYKDVIGMSKEIYEKAINSTEVDLYEKVTSLKESGKLVLEEQYHDKFDDLLNQCANDMPHAMFLESAIKVTQSLNEGKDFDSVKAILNEQGYCGELLTKLVDDVKGLCSRGESFAEHVQSERESDRIQSKERGGSKQYLEVKFELGSSLEDAVKELQAHNRAGALVCGEFNGVMLYSDSVTMDCAYKEIVGKTKEELDNAKHEIDLEELVASAIEEEVIDAGDIDIEELDELGKIDFGEQDIDEEIEYTRDI